jgi:hypothetical protein
MKIKVALINLGERLDIDLRRLSEKLNSLQESFQFGVGRRISAASMGNPDIKDKWYRTSTLLQQLPDPGRESADYVVGLTHVKISRAGDGLYFSHSDLQGRSVVSLNPSLTKFAGPLTDVEQYAAYLTMCELLINAAGADPSHTLPDRCLFDDCANREDVAPGIEAGQICSVCTAALEKHGVSKQTIDDARAVLVWCRTRPLLKALKFAATNPISLLADGALIGWLASFVGSKYLPAALGIWLLVHLASLDNAKRPRS